MSDIASQKQRAGEVFARMFDDNSLRARLDFLRSRLDLAQIKPFAAGFFTVVTVALIAWPFLPTRYEAPATIVLLVGARDDDPTSTVKQMRQTPDENETQSDVDLLSSPDLGATVVAHNHLERDSEFNGSNGWSAWLGSLLGASAPSPVMSERIARRNLTKHLKVARDRKSYTVTFGYWSNDPAKAAVLTQSLLDAYMALQPALKRDAIVRTTAWLQDRVSRLKRRAAAADKEVEDLMESSGLMDRGAEASLQSQLTTLSAEYAAVQARSIDDDVKVETLQTMQAQKTLDDAPEILSSSAIQKLKENRALLASRPGALLSESAATTSQIRAEQNHIVAASVAQADADKRRLTLLGHALATVRGAIKSRAEAQLRLDVQQRDAKASHTVLEDSLVRLDSQTSLAMTVAPEIQIAARPEQPFQAIFPNRMLGALGTLLVATLCGLALVFRRRSTIEQPLPRFIGPEPEFG